MIQIAFIIVSIFLLIYKFIITYIKNNNNKNDQINNNIINNYTNNKNFIDKLIYNNDIKNNNGNMKIYGGDIGKLPIILQNLYNLIQKIYKESIYDINDSCLSSHEVRSIFLNEYDIKFIIPIYNNITKIRDCYSSNKNSIQYKNINNQNNEEIEISENDKNALKNTLFIKKNLSINTNIFITFPLFNYNEGIINYNVDNTFNNIEYIGYYYEIILLYIQYMIYFSSENHSTYT
jgi:hypothetical protein